MLARPSIERLPGKPCGRNCSTGFCGSKTSGSPKETPAELSLHSLRSKPAAAQLNYQSLVQEFGFGIAMLIKVLRGASFQAVCRADKVLFDESPAELPFSCTQTQSLQSGAPSLGFWVCFGHQLMSKNLGCITREH